MKTKLMTFAMMMAVLGTVSCSKDLYDEGKANELKQAEEAAKQAQFIEQYKANFEKKYGKIDPNQSWDFSTYDVTFYANTSSNTRAGGPGAPGGPAGPAGPLNPPTPPTPPVNPIEKELGWYEVEDNTIALMKTVFEEGHDNTQNFMNGTFFELTVPDNDFYILPIFMGQSGGNFQLFMHVEGVANEIKVWDKWENIAYKEKGNEQNYTLLTKQNSRSGNNLVGVKKIASKPIKIQHDKLPKGAKMYFYLKITEVASGYNHKDDKLGCLNGYIKEYEFKASDINLTSLPGIDINKEIKCKFFGCEDASTSKTDKDFNDVVFLCYGQPEVPTSGKVKDLYSEVIKRYMIEDLGESDDTDFNDVVVDVVEKYTATIQTYDDGVTPLSGFENPDWIYQGTEARIRALGGTLDFELTIGKTKWRKSDKMTDWSSMTNGNTFNPNYNAEPLFTYAVEDFDAELNNVSLTVFQKDGEAVAGKVNFPAKGTVPMMIATNTDINWSPERLSFDFEQYQETEEEGTGEPETITIE
jgi:hypothetical protein